MLDKIKRADMLAKDIYLIDKCQGTLRKSFAYQKPPSEIHMKYREKKTSDPNEIKQENINELVLTNREMQRAGYPGQRSTRNNLGGVASHQARLVNRSVDLATIHDKKKLLNETSGVISGGFTIDHNIPALPKVKLNETALQSSDTAPFKAGADPTKHDTHSLIGPTMSLDSPIRLNQDSACKIDGTLR